MPISLLPNSLRYVEAVAKNGSIQAAARAIPISASAINRQILLLEEAVGVQLFERHASGMTLTQAGEMLVVLARKWQNEGNDLWSELKKMQGIDSGRLKIAVMDSMVNCFLPEFANKVATKYPMVQIDLEVMTPTDAIDSIESGNMDIAMAFNVRPHRNIEIMWTEQLPFGCVVAPSHPLANHSSLEFDEITAYPLVLQSHALAIRHKLELDHDWVIHESHQPLITNSLQFIKVMVRQGNHVAITSELDVAKEVIDGSIIFIPIRDAASSQRVSLVKAESRSLSRVAQSISTLFIDTIVTSLSEARQTNRQ
ncbi:LysR family transcriptional regulator [Veronia pacifica]|uniref:HTH lysR-type domain-containing protein n=1 Tax=Veronia pacifica TaxID=1080227 RepID=A0A1C3EPG3_9GAMM|nr:LysR family transcriptional regulator [Veronia pacifica]ODA35115.1 hypothetical protein A8L45_05405 [Veronia pacifica]